MNNKLLISGVLGLGTCMIYTPIHAGEAQAQNRETRVKESVNVRSDATTDSDRIALAYQGDAITEIESYDNGWSKVEYKGQTGYVKTEFLE